MNTFAIPHLQDMEVAPFSAAELSAAFAIVDARFDAAATPEALVAAVKAWDHDRRQWSTWRELVSVRYTQNTQDAERDRAREEMEALWPMVIGHTNAVRARLLVHPDLSAVTDAFGGDILTRWQMEMASFDPRISDDLVRESALQAKYTSLLASAQIPYQGKILNLSGLLRFMQDPDRSVREASTRLYWGWFDENGPALDALYDELVALRTSMARTMGHATYTPLGYLRMLRLDYGPDDVARFREQVREFVVPLAVKIREQQRQQLGLDALMFWDEPVLTAAGNPAPQGDHDWMVARATEMFDALHPEMSSFFRLLQDRGLMDLEGRAGKAGGGYCTDLSAWGVPFIFANFNGTKGDVVVFTHEMGHAFQGWMSRDKPLMDQIWPTMESAEIHSMSLEFLTWPHMERFFGPEHADRFRWQHLAETLLFIPYGVAIDHFQHLVFEKPDATAADRHEMWQQMEAMYLPWRNYGDLPALPRGAAWQRQIHVFGMPFYYIDYTLAATCAMQFWVRAEADRDEALDAYVTLCRRGGEASFRNLCAGAGLRAPFEDGALEQIVARAAQTLGV